MRPTSFAAKVSAYDNRNDIRCSLCVCVRLPSFLKASCESTACLEGEGLFFSFTWVVEALSDCTGPPSIGSIVATALSLKIETASEVGFSNWMGTPAGEDTTMALAACSRMQGVGMENHSVYAHVP